jgi:hypothetical protein
MQVSMLKRSRQNIQLWPCPAETLDGRDDRCAVMLGKFKICPVDHSFAFRYTRYSGFKVVRPEYSRYSAKYLYALTCAVVQLS